MLNRRRKNSANRLLFNKITLSVIGFLIIIAISIPLARNVSKQYRINKEIKDLEKEIGVLKGNSSSLNNLIEYLKSDQFNEEQARLNLNYKKEGEQVAVVKDEYGVDINNSGAEIDYFNINDLDKIEKNKNDTNPISWWKYFFGS